MPCRMHEGRTQRYLQPRQMSVIDCTCSQECCRRRFVSSDTTFLFPTASPSQGDEVEDAWELDLMTLERESNDRGPE